MLARHPEGVGRARPAGRPPGQRGVRHEAIKQVVQIELPVAAWQRCMVHFARNILAEVPQREAKAVAADLKPIFRAVRRETAERLAEDFAERYQADYYPKAVQALQHGLDEALTYTICPKSPTTA